FGPSEKNFKPYLVPHGDGTYSMKPEYSTQKQVDKHFEKAPHNEENERIKHGLFDLISNVILFEVEGSDMKKFHFRFGVDATFSFRHLEWNTQQQLRELYTNYFYRRRDYYWELEGMKKLPALKRSTNMLICRSEE